MKLRTETAKKKLQEGFARVTGLFLKKQTPVAVAIHDGYAWRAHIVAQNEKQWKVGKKADFEGNDPHRLPEDLLAFAARNHARRVRILIPADIYAIAMTLPDDCEPEEAHSALAHELETETELAAHAMRLAAVRADRLGLGGPSGTFLAAPFEQSVITAFDAACRAAGLVFGGIGALELAVVNHHALTHGQSRCLILRRHSCFYATSAAGAAPFAAQSIPVFFSPDDAAAHPERYERIARRFGTHANLPLVVWSPAPVTEDRLAIISSAAGNRAALSVRAMRDCAAAIALSAAGVRDIGSLSDGCALVGKGAGSADPHRAGTWLFFSIIAITLATVGMLYLNLHWDMRGARQREQAWETIKQQRTGLEARHAGLKQERNDCLLIERELSSGTCLPAGLLPLLTALRRDMPVYTRLVRLYQDETGVLVLEGSTFYQQAIDLLGQAMCNVMQPLGLRVDAIGIESKTANGELRFTYRIISAQGGLP